MKKRARIVYYHFVELQHRVGQSRYSRRRRRFVGSLIVATCSADTSLEFKMVQSCVFRLLN
jgi:hypothetical protein